MVRKILSIIGVVGTVASILSLIFIKDIPLWLRIIIGIVGIGLLAILAVFLFQERQVNKIVCKSDVEIKAAMRKLIKTQGKVCIVSYALTVLVEGVRRVARIICAVSKSADGSDRYKGVVG